MEIRKVAKRMLPATFRRWRARLIVLRHRRLNSTRSARNVFSEIYAKNLWGGTPGTYCSGSGSEEKQTEQYVSYVRQFILEHGITSVVDLGCGDFRVGRCLLDGRATYLGIDVVPDLIDYNTKTFGSDKIRFQCLDITTK